MSSKSGQTIKKTGLIIQECNIGGLQEVYVRQRKVDKSMWAERVVINYIKT